MFKKMSFALLGCACTFMAGTNGAGAFDNSVPNDPPAVLYAPQVPPAPVRVASNSNMGGGFIEFLFGDGPGRGPAYAPQQPVYQQQPAYYDQRRLPPMGEPQMQGAALQQEAIDPRQRPFDPRFEKQLVDYNGKESPGTIVVDTPNKFLYLVEGNGRAMRYGIGVGRPGFTWSGVKSITRQARMAGLDAAEGDARAPSRSAPAHGRRSGKSSRRPRHVSRLDALPHSRLQRALDHRHQRLLRLHPHAQ
ncbi:lipoprotein-anchoring transpeptidase ErfK/SrfK [Bradyrhizobium liaoningense]